VKVGNGNSTQVFAPSSIEAEVGSIVEFVFWNNHTLTESTLKNPCTSNGEFDTGDEEFGANGTQVLSYLVQSSNSRYFYDTNLAFTICKDRLFALNPGNTMDQFLLNGILVPAAQSTATQSTTTQSTATTAAQSTAASENLPP
jgi:hypothetical protein